MSKIEVIETDDAGILNHRQPGVPILIKIRWWMIRKIAGKIPVMLNIEVSPHTKDQCKQPARMMHLTYGLIGGAIVAGNGCGITIRGNSK